MVGWRKDKYNRFKRPVFNPNDDFEYCIPKQALERTEYVLKQYGALKRPSEGIVYWAGTRENHKITVQAVIAPEADASPFNVMVDHQANAEVVNFIVDEGLVHIGQVHTHPKNWVDHSEVDDESAAFRCNGLLSLVVPNFASTGLMPLHICGFHRFENGAFIRLSNIYIKDHCFVNGSEEIIYKDLRRIRYA